MRILFLRVGIDRGCGGTLTNAAMHPESSHASRLTQRFAITLSRTWVKAAHQDLTARIRASVPGKIDLSIEDWQGKTNNGENEKELAASLGNHIDRRKEEAWAKMKLQLHLWATLATGIGLLFYALSGGISLLILAAGCFILFFTTRAKLRKAKEKILVDYARLKEKSLELLGAILAEVVEWRQAFTKLDSFSSEVVQLLEAISPDIISSTTAHEPSPDSKQSVQVAQSPIPTGTLSQPGSLTDTLAGAFPDWDLLPAGSFIRRVK